MRIEEGFGMGKCVNQEQIEGDTRYHRLGHDFARGEPVQQLAPVHHQLQCGDENAEGGEAEKVELRSLRIPVLRQGEIEADKGQNADRQVDVEDPAPGWRTAPRRPRR